MPTSWQVDCLRARIRSLDKEIKRVAEKDHPYPEPDSIYNSLQAVVKSRSDYFDEAAELLSERELQAVLNTVSTDLQRVAEEFSLADRVDSARIPFEILRSFSWAAKLLLGEECSTLVRLDTTYSYTISSCKRRFEDLGWSDYWHAKDSNILVLGFPSSVASSILLHSLAAHEFGHQFLYKFASEVNGALDSAILEVKREYNERLQEYVLDNVVKRERVPVQDAYEESRKIVEARLLKLGKNWLGEVFADLVAVRLVGASFLPAFDRMVFDVGRPSSTHPPGYLRRQMVGQYLLRIMPELMQDPIWKPFFDQGARMGDRRDKGQRDEWSPLYQIGEKICLLSLERLAAIVESCPCTFRELPQFVRIVGEMEDCMDNLAPPSVVLQLRGEPEEVFYFWLLMYACWHFRLDAKRFSVFSERHGWASDFGRAEEALGNLLLQSLQSLELRYRWRQRQAVD